MTKQPKTIGILGESTSRGGAPDPLPPPPLSGPRVSGPRESGPREPLTVAVAAPVDGRQSETASAIARGTLRALDALGFCGITEITLPTGRRADIIAINDRSEIWIVEIKSSVADFRADLKWPEYREFCDRLLFAVSPEFPLELLPADVGLLVADRYAGELVRPSPELKLAAHRRKQVLLRLARVGAARLQALTDPDYPRHAGPID